jgi:hypothetical protein
MQRKLMGIMYVDFKATGQLLIIYTAFIKYLRKNGNTTKEGKTTTCIFPAVTEKNNIIL